MALDAITTCRVEMKISWNVSKTRTGFQPITNNQDLSRVINFSLGTGAGQIDEIASWIETVTANTTEDIDLSANLDNVVGDLAVTLARVKFFLVELLATADVDQQGNVLGNECEGITIGGDVSAAFSFLVDASDKLVIENGEFMALVRKSATGLPVGAGSSDVLQIQNNDADTDAKVRITLFGCGS